MRLLHNYCALALAVILPILSSGQGKIELVSSEESPYFGAIRVVGMEEELAIWLQEKLPAVDDAESLIHVYPQMDDREKATGLPPMLGKVAASGGRLYFIPRFPFEQGRSYLAVFFLAKAYQMAGIKQGKGEKLTFQKQISIPVLGERPAARVAQLYPSTSHWPANQLKFYIQFSAPMRYGQAHHYIRLYDERGNSVENPFPELGQELWDQANQRLTVWFDPGRIKRGLIPNQQYGPPLQAGQRYRLVVDSQWQDAYGRPLEASFEKWITAGPEDRRRPSPENWQWNSPAAGTQEPLSLIFPEPMDHALLASSIRLFDEQGLPLPGEVQAINEETEWWFLPKEAWRPGAYQLRISTRLEDLAGNNLRRLFDTDIKENSNEEMRNNAFLEINVFIR